jgi:hypothetical protein
MEEPAAMASVSRDDSVVELARTVAADALGERTRMNAGAEERFIGVNIADAAQEGLVEEQRFDARLVAAELGGEFIERDFERFGAEAGNAAREVFAELDAAELAAIVVQKCRPVEGKNSVGVFGWSSAEQQAAGHAEVDHQITAAFDGGHDELAVALYGEDAAALQACSHRVGIAPAKDAEIAKFGAENTLARDGGDRADYGFDFGKFGHLGDLDIDIAAFHFDFKSGDALRGIVIVLAGSAIEFPAMVGTDYASIVDLPLAERSAAMETDTAEGADRPGGMAQRIGLVTHHHLHHRIRGQLRQRAHFEKRHLLIVK